MVSLPCQIVFKDEAVPQHSNYTSASKCYESKLRCCSTAGAEFLGHLSDLIYRFGQGYKDSGRGILCLLMISHKNKLFLYTRKKSASGGNFIASFMISIKNINFTKIRIS